MATGSSIARPSHGRTGIPHNSRASRRRIDVDAPLPRLGMGRCRRRKTWLVRGNACSASAVSIRYPGVLGKRTLDSLRPPRGRSTQPSRNAATEFWSGPASSHCQAKKKGLEDLKKDKQIRTCGFGWTRKSSLLRTASNRSGFGRNESSDRCVMSGTTKTVIWRNNR